MPVFHKGNVREPESLRVVDEALAKDHPGYRLGAGRVDEPDGTEWRAPEGKVRFIWLADGEGAVELPKGYRTQEGDGAALPPGYEPDHLSPQSLDHLRTLRDGLETCLPAIRPHVELLLSRWNDGALVGDPNSDLWGILNAEPNVESLTHSSMVAESLRFLFSHAGELGWSTKVAESSWEPIQSGDQLVAFKEAPVRVKGAFRYMQMDVHRMPGDEYRFSRTRRLRHIRDTSGGCNPSFDAFRRLSTCWRVDDPGLNRVNSHVVHIAADTASTHFHPLPTEAGGFGQSEIYFVLNPASHGLRPASEQPTLHIYPDLDHLTQFATFPLQFGDIVYIPPGTGHRGIDVFANVLGIPGFKPGNEFEIDAEIAAAAGEDAPDNRRFVP